MVSPRCRPILNAVLSTCSQCDSCCTPAYRLTCKTIYEERQVTCYKPQCETVYDQVEVTKQVPVWETQARERRFTVLKPVQETSMREERYVVQRPVYETIMRDASYDQIRNVTETRRARRALRDHATRLRNSDARRALRRSTAGRRDGAAAAMSDRHAAGDHLPNAVRRPRLLCRSGVDHSRAADVPVAPLGARDSNHRPGDRVGSSPTRRFGLGLGSDAGDSRSCSEYGGRMSSLSRFP